MAPAELRSREIKFLSKLKMHSAWNSPLLHLAAEFLTLSRYRPEGGVLGFGFI